MRVTVNSVQIMSTVVPVVDSVCDLGVVPGTWQPPHHVCSSQLGLPFSVLPASTTQTSRPFLDHRCSQDGDPGICILTPGLLQLTVFWHLRPLDTTTKSGSECCGMSRYWYVEARSYQPSPSAAALVTSSPAYKFQVGRCCLQVIIWPSSSILGWRLWTCCSCRPSSPTIVGHCHVCCSTNIHSVRRSGFSRCWTTVVEQPPVQITTVRPHSPSVPPGVKDVFVLLTGTPVPSDYFLVCYTNALTYLCMEWFVSWQYRLFIFS